MFLCGYHLTPPQPQTPSLPPPLQLYNVDVTLDPKPIPGDWNGAGGHTNFSTEATRTAPGGWDAIQAQIAKLEKRHAVHIAGYGEGNERRLTGKHETSSMETFSWGVANRGCSIRVGRSVPVDKCGYYEGECGLRGGRGEGWGGDRSNQTNYLMFYFTIPFSFLPQTAAPRPTWTRTS